MKVTLIIRLFSTSFNSNTQWNYRHIRCVHVVPMSRNDSQIKNQANNKRKLKSILHSLEFDV